MKRLLRVTPNGKVKERVSETEIIKIARSIWIPEFEKNKFKIGYGVVIFFEKDFKEAVLVFASDVAVPLEADLSDKNWNTETDNMIKVLEKNNYYVMKSNISLYQEIDEVTSKRVMNEVIKRVE